MQLTNEHQASLLSTTKKTKFTKVKLYLGTATVSFCEYCYQCYKANEKCDYCDQVYFSTAFDGEVDGKMWMDCDDCAKWNHPDCEI